MKALILAGGRGKRLVQNVTQEKNKCMLLVNGKPLLEYSLDNCANTEVDEIIMVVGYRAEEIINYYGNKYKSKSIKYVIQWEQRGLVDAIECAKEEIAKDDFMLLLGDQVMINPRHQSMIDKFKNENVFALCGGLYVSDIELIKKTYSVIQDHDNIIYRLIEKPSRPLNNFMGTGDCIFKNEIFNYSELTPISYVRNEKELPDLIQCAIDDGKKVKSFLICDGYVNVNTKDDLLTLSNFLETKVLK
jgi:dTDP-glucose pyrophosphorylase